jgi:hypothetical protein
MTIEKSDRQRDFRQKLWAVLHEGKGPSGHAYNFLLILLVLISTAIVPLEFFAYNDHFDQVVLVLETMIVSVFATEYILRIYSAPNRMRYLFSAFGIIDLLSILPFYSSLFGTPYIRLLRLVRLLKLTEIDAAAETDEELKMQREMGLVGGENVEYIVTKTPIILLFGSLPSIFAITFGLVVLIEPTGYIGIGLAVILFSFAIMFLWKVWLDFSYDVIYVTNYRLILQNQHLLGRSSNQVSFTSVTNVKPFHHSLIGYILRYGSLMIDTAADSTGAIKLDFVRRHEKAARIIMQKCFEAQQRFDAPVTGPVNTPEDLQGYRL